MEFFYFYFLLAVWEFDRMYFDQIYPPPNFFQIYLPPVYIHLRILS